MVDSRFTGQVDNLPDIVDSVMESKELHPLVFVLRKNELFMKKSIEVFGRMKYFLYLCTVN